MAIYDFFSPNLMRSATSHLSRWAAGSVELLTLRTCGRT